jgi:hypothetical protein
MFLIRTESLNHPGYGLHLFSLFFSQINPPAIIYSKLKPIICKVGVSTSIVAVRIREKFVEKIKQKMAATW